MSLSDLKNIEKFCKTRDVKYLSRLSENTKQLFISMSRASYKIKRIEKQIPSLVLKYFKISVPKSLLPSGDLYKRALKNIEKMDVSVTGARTDDILLGAMKSTKGAMIKTNGEIKPLAKELDIIRNFDDLWAIFLNKLSQFEFFTDMSKNEKELWLAMNETTSDQVIGEGEDTFEILELEILSPN